MPIFKSQNMEDQIDHHNASFKQLIYEVHPQYMTTFNNLNPKENNFSQISSVQNLP